MCVVFVLNVASQNFTNMFNELWSSVTPLISFLSVWSNRDFLAEIVPLDILRYISEFGSVDGVTRINQLTEDGLEYSEGESVLLELRRACGFI